MRRVIGWARAVCDSPVHRDHASDWRVRIGRKHLFVFVFGEGKSTRALWPDEARTRAFSSSVILTHGVCEAQALLDSYV